MNQKNSRPEAAEEGSGIDSTDFCPGCKVDLAKVRQVFLGVFSMNDEAVISYRMCDECVSETNALMESKATDADKYQRLQDIEDTVLSDLKKYGGQVVMERAKGAQ